MESIITLIIYGVVIYSIVAAIKKKKTGGVPGKPVNTVQSQVRPQQRPAGSSGGMMRDIRESGSMAHEHRESGVYDSYNRKNKWNDSGTMPHKHETRKYTASMSDASKLPPGYILLNGEPVRVADLEGK